ncbi:MAG: indole-3-glycerol phosphate synthase TrpC [Coriobacteriales bacterium]|jgi:indole-3-glycerol phosphate synthase|nr:indole-3-glycerol phosphate synthase TrpC [Coriobacteriales bacterium]
MPTILETIAADTAQRVAQAKLETPLEVLREKALALPFPLPFEAALAAPGLAVIAEVKKASPSKGIIAEDFPYLEIAREYQAAGAAALSVLTEPTFFKGSPRYLQEIAQAVTIPVLRKDFIIDPHQIYEAKVLGAAAILLICALLDDKQLAEFLALAQSLGLCALVETHDAQEVGRAIACGARIIGVNNRDLATFAVDLNTSKRLRALVPSDLLFVAESGIASPQDAAQLSTFGVDAVLIGEALMKAQDKRGFLAGAQAAWEAAAEPEKPSRTCVMPKDEMSGL